MITRESEREREKSKKNNRVVRSFKCLTVTGFLHMKLEPNSTANKLIMSVIVAATLPFSS